jgi:hypothetical protein
LYIKTDTFSNKVIATNTTRKYEEEIYISLLFAMYLRLASNSRSSCLNLLIAAGIIGVYHHARPQKQTDFKKQR